jgi:hydroxyacylglutathione hydrolase
MSHAAGALVIEPIPCLKDNYAYLLYQPGSGDGYVVDPSEAAPVSGALERRHLTLRGILVTHHHPDHVGGIPDLLGRWGGSVGYVAGFAGDRGRIPGQTRFLEAPEDRFLTTDLLIGGRTVVVRHIPGHTRGAMALGLASGGDVPADVFTGDTLFAAGCGRLFEGTPAQMFASLQALTTLPEETRLWFGHEYTASNLRFAAHVEPDNAAVRDRQAALPAQTTPTTVALERATNPFVRAGSVEELAARRAAKDHF